MWVFCKCLFHPPAIFPALLSSCAVVWPVLHTAVTVPLLATRALCSTLKETEYPKEIKRVHARPALCSSLFWVQSVSAPYPHYQTEAPLGSAWLFFNPNTFTYTFASQKVHSMLVCVTCNQHEWRFTHHTLLFIPFSCMTAELLLLWQSTHKTDLFSNKATRW